ncbi:MAG TPA: NYN domain-containing protein [Peptococcaceae bacterium]|nr:NYN domain-containing protein [Peptococcaceae bacterium]
MDKEYLLVDGYNLIFQAPELKSLGDLEHARARLVDLLINYAALSGQKVTVVFDAHHVPGGTRRELEESGVTVIYTAEGETADGVIERKAGELAKEGLVYVVTADYAEQRVVLGQGAYRMPPAEFWQRVKSLSLNAPRSCEKQAERYLEERLAQDIKEELDAWRRGKSM